MRIRLKKLLIFFASAHKKLLSHEEAKKSLGTSIAIVGPMDKEKNLLMKPPDMPKWKMFHLKRCMSRL